MLVNPRLIIEVLSPSTARYDYGPKFIAYRSIESFQEYLLVSQDRPHIIQYVRAPGGQWMRRDIEGMENVMAFTSVDCELALSEIYRLVKFPPAADIIRPV
jgi:Uma2 family endonuclease